MADTQFYFRLSDGSLVEKVRVTGMPTPPKPIGATVLTQSEYTAALAVVRSADSAQQTATRAAETAAARLRYNSTLRVVASASAPQRVKDISQYVCPGTDDQAQINAAITDALAEGGGTVLLSQGTFFLGDTVNIPGTQSLKLAGSGWATSLKVQPASNRYAIKFTGDTDTRVMVSDMTVDGSMLDQSSAGGGIWAPGAVQCRFENIKFTNCFDECLYLAGTTAGAFGHNNVISHCLFEQGMGSPGRGRGIRFDSSDENVVDHCDFEYMGGAIGATSCIYDPAGTQFINGCNFVNGGADKAAVRVQDCASTKIQGCNFDGVSGTAVLIAAKACSVSDCTFFGVGMNGTAGANSGIFLEYGTANNHIVDNILVTAEANGAAHSLIREVADGGGGNNYVTGNTLVQKGTAVHGLLDLSGTGTWVRGNKGAGPAGDEAGPVKLVAGAVSDGSFPSNRPPSDGTMAVDTTNSRFYVRLGGVWKSASLT